MTSALPHLAGYIADLETPATLEDAIRQRNAWVESAMHFSNGENYYRGLLDQIAAHIGPESRLAENGDNMQSVVRARLPDLVRDRLAGAAHHE